MKIYSMEDLVQAELTILRAGQKLKVSVFLMDGLLIDTGPSRKQDELISLFEQSDIEQVILTHHHEDHAGMAHWLEQGQLPVYMHQNGIAHCQRKERLPLYRRLTWGKRLPFHALPAAEHFQTEHYAWETIHTPGHADDHIALYNKEKGWMFGGDLYVHPRPKSMYRFESLPQLIHSLRRILSYDFDVYIDSHYGIIQDGKHKVREKLQYLIDIQQQVLFLYNEGATSGEIRKKMFPNRHFMHYISLFENSPRHLINSIIDPS